MSAVVLVLAVLIAAVIAGATLPESFFGEDFSEDKSPTGFTDD